MKEKVDVSLDNRQIFSLFLVGLVVLGAVFVIGVVVGKKLASTPQPTEAPDLLTALDQKAKQMEQERQDPPLTFQEELTKKSVERVTTADVKPAAAPKVEAAKGEATAPAKVATAKAELPAAAPAKTSSTPAAKTARAEATPAQKTPAATASTHGEAAASAPKLPELDGKVPPTPVATRTTEQEDLHSAFARLQMSTSKPSAGAYSVQVAASQSRGDAEAQVTRLKAKGYSPYIVSATVPGKGTWYRVRLGSFSSREDASRYLDDFRRETRLDAFVASAQ